MTVRPTVSGSKHLPSGERHLIKLTVSFHVGEIPLQMRKEEEIDPSEEEKITVGVILRANEVRGLSSQEIDSEAIRRAKRLLRLVVGPRQAL